MDERLGFELDIDVKSAMLGHAIAALNQMDEKLLRIVGSLDKMEQRSRSSARTATNRFTELASSVSLVKQAIGAATTAWTAFDRAGDYAVKAMGERSATIRGYTQLLGGDKKQAGLEYYRAQEFAQKTDFSSEQIEKSQARLLAQGFRGKDLYATLFSAADLAAIMPGDKNQTLERVTMAMSQIKAKGKLQGEELTQQLAEAGLNTTLVKQQLAKAYGIKVGDVDKKLSAGQVGADVALPAIQRAILQQLGTSKAGEYSASSAGGITALISNRDEAVKNLLKGFDADENLPAMERYKRVLKEQGQLFNVTAESGRNLSLVVQDLANSSVSAKAGFSSFISGIIDKASETYVQQLNKQNAGKDLDKESAQTSREAEKLGRTLGELGWTAAALKDSWEEITRSTMANVNEGIQRLREGRYYDFFFAAHAKDLDLETQAEADRKQRDIASAFEGKTGGAGKGGGGIGGLADLHPELAPNKVSAAATAKKKAEESSSKGRGAEYRGVFWDYQFNGGSTGRWAAPPTLAEFAKGTHTTASALTSIASRGPDGQQLIININGYNRDKMELAHAIANELARVARQPR